MEGWSTYLTRGTPPAHRGRKWIGKCISFDDVRFVVGISPEKTHVPSHTSRRAGGNWKCNNTLGQVTAIVNALNVAGHIPLTSEVVIAIPNLHILGVKASLRPDISVATQDVGLNAGFGAYTGETSASQIADAGIRWTLAGHSERRVGFGHPGETNDVVGRKTAVALAAGLSVAVCIGEQLADRESGRTMAVCSEQLAAVAQYLKELDWKKIVIAYEPVWAIGTGKVATPEQAEETHQQIRAWVSTHVSPAVAAEIRIVYGGSVTGASSKALVQCPNIDGFLVGGASLKPEFVDIIRVRSVPPPPPRFVLTHL